MIRDYQHECPSQGSGRKRPSYNKAKVVELLAKEQLVGEGIRYMKSDWFQFERHYKQKKLEASAIEAKWKDKLQAEGAYDMLGKKPDFPERILLKTEDYVDTKARARRGLEIQREAAMDKKLLEDDAAHELLDNKHGTDSAFFGKAGAVLKKQDAAAASSSKRQRLSFGSTSTNDGADESVADLTVARLLQKCTCWYWWVGGSTVLLIRPAHWMCS